MVFDKNISIDREIIRDALKSFVHTSNIIHVTQHTFDRKNSLVIDRLNNMVAEHEIGVMYYKEGIEKDIIEYLTNENNLNIIVEKIYTSKFKTLFIDEEPLPYIGAVHKK